MKKTLKRIYMKVAYSESTHNILNNFTLQIKDPEIRKQYDDYRFANYDALHKPILAWTIFYFLYRLM